MREEKIFVADLIKMTEDEIDNTINNYAEKIINYKDYTDYNYVGDYEILAYLNLDKYGKLKPEFTRNNQELTLAIIPPYIIVKWILQNSIKNNEKIWDPIKFQVQMFLTDAKNHDKFEYNPKSKNYIYNDKYMKLFRFYWDQENKEWDVWSIYFDVIQDYVDVDEWYKSNYPNEYNTSYKKEKESYKEQLLEFIKREVNYHIRSYELQYQVSLRKFREEMKNDN